MSNRAIVSISCVSQSGLLTTVTESLAAQGCNLADTTFAVLSGSAEFTTVCEMPEGLAEEIGADLWAKDPASLIGKLATETDRRATPEQHTVGRHRRTKKTAAA